MAGNRHTIPGNPSPGFYPLAFLLLLSIPFQACLANETPIGDFFGARSSEKPHWFKESFLEFEDDVAEAAAANRRIMLYFHQDGCPYCARLVEENFADPQLKSYIVDHFDGITLNLWGDREVVSVGGQDFTEKTFAAALKVQYTPTLIFLDEKGQVVLRLNGYYPPDDFRAALTYVAQKLETKTSFAEYRLGKLKDTGGKLRSEDFYIVDTDLKQVLQKSGAPLVVYFESRFCKKAERPWWSISNPRIASNAKPCTIASSPTRQPANWCNKPVMSSSTSLRSNN